MAHNEWAYIAAKLDLVAILSFRSGSVVFCYELSTYVGWCMSV